MGARQQPALPELPTRPPEAAVKRDLSDALAGPATVAAALRDDLHAAMDALLARRRRRAQSGPTSGRPT